MVPTSTPRARPTARSEDSATPSCRSSLDTSVPTLMSLLVTLVLVDVKLASCSVPTRSTGTRTLVSLPVRVPTGEDLTSVPRPLGRFSGVRMTSRKLNFPSYGLVYYVTEMLRDLDNTDWRGKRVLISGAGNVAQYAALKVLELGGTVLSLSDSTGALIATGNEGFTAEEIMKIADIKLQRKSLTAFATGSKFQWHEGKRPWTLVSQADVALPSASQNELNEEEAKALIRAGVRYVAEGSNM